MYLKDKFSTLEWFMKDSVRFPTTRINHILKFIKTAFYCRLVSKTEKKPSDFSLVFCV